MIEDEDGVENLLPPIALEAGAVIRDEKHRAQFGPTMQELLPDELERLDKETYRDNKRKKRGGRARRNAAISGQQLHEREAILTMRTSSAPATRGNKQNPTALATLVGSSGEGMIPTPEAGGRRGRRAAAVAATQATAAMLAADRALDRAEREGRDFEDEDDSDSPNRTSDPRVSARGKQGGKGC